MYRVLRRLQPKVANINLSYSRNYCRVTRRCDMTPKALIFLPDGVDATDFFITVDILLRGGVYVTVCGVPDKKPITCTAGLKLEPISDIEQVKANIPYEVILLPGGLEATKIMGKSQEVGDLLRYQECNGLMVGAISTAPLVLKMHKVFRGRSLTSDLRVEKEIMEDSYKFKNERLHQDGPLITSKSSGTAFRFALYILELLKKKEAAIQVAIDIGLPCF